jgi:hypothetical protein
MAYDEFLVERVRQLLNEKHALFFEKNMMGGRIFMVNEKMCLGVDIDKKTNESRIMVRIGKEAYEDALREKGTREMDFTGTVMRGFLFIGPDGFDLDEDLEFWVDKALAFNPFAKKSKKKSS